ncbi:mitochondrial sodium/hydrogen exchanger 9B2-like protein [Leptotrombidium deliense]|uniref:Mitochondrial sodium/hydrogen exchanger 9B2-like protein n=1 Tax=Leptotrombidium deliense TaxID=299467 RepID=A0A443SWM6_9ACAR|nr:mitochondrial sodium/hydrogen exchanger 9B2-like protein [Leptotrombidium deliense]
MAIIDLRNLADFCLNKVAELLLFSLIYGTVWLIIGSDALPPNGRIFVLFAVFASAYVGAELCTAIYIPPILGMLVGGCFVRNSSYITIDSRLSSILRSFALATILLRAGIGLNPVELRKLSSICLRLAFTPCLVETITSAITAYIFYDFPVVWGFILGFVLSAVSPGIVVKLMLELQEQGLGTDKGIPTLIMAASSLDDIVAITGFGIALSIALSMMTSLLWNLLKAPLEAFCGIFFGAAVGCILIIIPSQIDSAADNNMKIRHNCQRVCLTIIFGLFLVLITRELELGSSGALAALTLTFVAALSWRHYNNQKTVEETLKVAWNLIEPFLFGLIGAEIQISILELKIVLLSLLTLSIGLVMRCLTVVLVCYGYDFNMKEKFFIALSWLPKATVQAAIGPVALDNARELNDTTSIKYATLVLTIAVISIFVTAPLGSMAITLSAPRLLSKSNQQKPIENPAHEPVEITGH